MENEDIEGLFKEIQSILKPVPLIFAGSGLGVSWGLPSTEDLGIALKKNLQDANEFKDFLACLEKADNFEQAMNDANLGEAQRHKITCLIWEEVSQKDLDFYFCKIFCRETFSLARILAKFLQARQQHIHIVTTNYDRLIEYAADICQADCYTGLSGKYSCFIDDQFSFSKDRRNGRPKISLYKVHGSLDWFADSEEGDVFTAPQRQKIPDNYSPYLVIPGNQKFIQSNANPYWNIRHGSDEAVRESQSFLCVGYGFNDPHIQSSLTAAIREGANILVLTKQATQACHDMMSRCEGTGMILESNKNLGTLVHRYPRTGKPVVIDSLNLWCLDTFYQQCFEK